MKYFDCPALTMTLDECGRIVELCAPGGVNLIREVQPFAELAFYELRPAFTNEWVHPVHVEAPEYGEFSSFEDTQDGFVLHYTYKDDQIAVHFAVEPVNEGLIVILRKVESTGVRPTRIRFARMSLITDADTAASGLMLELKTDGIDLPGFMPEQAAQAYDHLGYDDCRWMVTAAAVQLFPFAQ